MQVVVAVAVHCDNLFAAYMVCHYRHRFRLGCRTMAVTSALSLAAAATALAALALPLLPPASSDDHFGRQRQQLTL